MTDRIAPGDAALQHGRAPRPLPLFLSLVQEVAKGDPDLARRALEGLSRYRREPRASAPTPRPVAASAGIATLRDHGGAGRPLVLVPSLINPTDVLDLPGRSLAAVLAQRHRVLLVDWGAARERSSLDLGEHVTQLLVPLLESLGEPVDLVGYCLGGTMAIAAANLVPVRRIATLAAPWRFDAYPETALAGLGKLWREASPAAQHLGLLPVEILQIAFWSLDPGGMVSKFARLAGEPVGSATVQRFVSLEDWANDGEPIPLPAAREMIERLFEANEPGTGQWRVGGRTVTANPAPALHFTASGDRIVPAASAPPGATRAIHSGHVGMIIGSHAPVELHAPLLAFLGPDG
ncbi:alpha/beta fold hydrolase [Sphingomonas sp.]|uniref:alpha/beta fold hydrolase n=1 Tax=Sphingomonas sp. TaxID=28214 RepID=UPI00286D2749|nr:alpha/beta fold hydrolase [Sphingomonas sp.]